MEERIKYRVIEEKQNCSSITDTTEVRFIYSHITRKDFDNMWESGIGYGNVEDEEVIGVYDTFEEAEKKLAEYNCYYDGQYLVRCVIYKEKYSVYVEDDEEIEELLESEVIETANMRYNYRYEVTKGSFEVSNVHKASLERLSNEDLHRIYAERDQNQEVVDTDDEYALAKAGFEIECENASISIGKTAVYFLHADVIQLWVVEFNDNGDEIDRELIDEYIRPMPELDDDIDE